MAIANTVAVQTDWQSITGKTLSSQSLLTSKLKIVRVTVTNACAGCYATGGCITDLSLGGRLTKVLAVVPLHNSEGYYVEYVEGAANDAALGKLLLRGDLDTATNAIGFTEISVGTVPQGCIFELLVFGV